MLAKEFDMWAAGKQVRVARKEITEAQAQTVEVTSKLKEKEAMLIAVQKELMAEGESLAAKVSSHLWAVSFEISAANCDSAAVIGTEDPCLCCVFFLWGMEYSGHKIRHIKSVLFCVL